MTDQVPGCAHPLALPDRVRWWLIDAAWEGPAQRATHAIREPRAIPPEHLLKTGVRRLVFTGEVGGKPRWVAKAFPLTPLRSRLKHDKYARSEARNLALARQRSVPAPRVYGWGEQRGWGVVRWNAVLMERIGGRSFADALEQAEDEVRRTEVFDRCVLLFRSLHLAGCNHIDLKPEALCLGDDRSEDAIIDFQYCTFRDRPCLATIMAQAGHFVHWWERQHPPREWVDQWVHRLMEVLEVPAGRRTEACRILSENRRRILPIAARLQQ